MLTVTGRVVRQDLGPGVWVLEGQDGRRWALQGGDPRSHEGRVVTVTGRVKDDAVGVGMVGAPVLAVQDIRAGS